jgi:probable HAF family extracellular repeat protein
LEYLEERCLLTYAMTDLGTLPGGTFSEAKSVNAANPVQVVGSADTSNGTTHAFLWDRVHGIQDLGTLGGPNSGALGINDAGQVVGYSETSTGETHAFLDSGGVMTDLGTLAHGHTSSATAINAAGQVVGFSTITPSSALKYQAFLYSNGVMTDLRSLSAGPGSNSVAWALDNSDPVQVVGQSQGPSYPPPCDHYPNYHAADWQAPTKTDLGTLPGGHESHAFGINASGQVVGDSAAAETPPCYNSPARAFLRDPDGTMTRLDDGVAGPKQSRAYGINAFSQVVGTWSDTTGAQDIPKYAFLWENQVFTDLISLVPDRGWSQLINASAINDRGQLVGWGVRSDTGATHAFLMTSIYPPPDSPPLADPVAIRVSAASAPDPEGVADRPAHRTSLPQPPETPVGQPHRAEASEIPRATPKTPPASDLVLTDPTNDGLV